MNGPGANQGTRRIVPRSAGPRAAYRFSAGCSHRFAVRKANPAISRPVGRIRFRRCVAVQNPSPPCVSATSASPERVPPWPRWVSFPQTPSGIAGGSAPLGLLVRSAPCCNLPGKVRAAFSPSSRGIFDISTQNVVKCLRRPLSWQRTPLFFPPPGGRGSCIGPQGPREPFSASSRLSFCDRNRSRQHDCRQYCRLDNAGARCYDDRMYSRHRRNPEKPRGKYSESDKAIGQSLRRHFRHINETKMLETLGWDRSTWSRILNGVRPLRLSEAIVLTNRCGVPWPVLIHCGPVAE